MKLIQTKTRNKTKIKGVYVIFFVFIIATPPMKSH